MGLSSPPNPHTSFLFLKGPQSLLFHGKRDLALFFSFLFFFILFVFVASLKFRLSLGSGERGYFSLSFSFFSFLKIVSGLASTLPLTVVG